MEPYLLLRATFALLLVLGLVALAAWILRRSPTLLATMRRSGPERRLALVERLVLDARRHLVIVRDGDKEHVLLLGATTEVCLETRPAVIEAPPALTLIDRRAS